MREKAWERRTQGREGYCAKVTAGKRSFQTWEIQHRKFSGEENPHVTGETVGKAPSDNKEILH